MHAPGDVRVEDREIPTIVEPTDAIIRLTASCICGSDLWPYRGAEPVDDQPMGHEYVGVVTEIGADVSTVKVGDFVVGSFFASDNTCEICQAGYQSHCVHRQPGAATGTQAEYARIPLADGTLVATPGQPDADLIPSLLAASDVLGTGWFAAVAAEVGPGKTVAVVGDGAVGLLASSPPASSAPSGSSRCAGTPTGRRSPASSAPPTSSRSAARRAWRGSRSSPTGSAPTAHRGGRHPGVDDAGHPRHPRRAATSATSASPTTSRSTAWSCSSPACTCTAAPHRSAASCPT